jgi:hypothetical protein
MPLFAGKSFPQNLKVGFTAVVNVRERMKNWEAAEKINIVLSSVLHSPACIRSYNILEYMYMSFNRATLAIFGPVLILVGVLGFVLSPELTPTSDAPPYNVFHIIFGAIGVLIVLSRYEWPAVIFNMVFGTIDLYQFVASYADLFPEQFFQWTPADDFLHISLGLILALLGLYGFLTNRPVPVKQI